MKKLFNKLIPQCPNEPAYFQEKTKALIVAGFCIIFGISIGIVLHIIGQEPPVVIAGDILMLVVGVLTFPLVYYRHLRFAANLIISALVVMITLNNLVTDYFYSDFINSYRILETVIFFILIIFAVTSFVYNPYQVILTSLAGLVIIIAHYLIISYKFHDGAPDIHSVTVFIAYLVVYLIVSFLAYRLLFSYHRLINRLEAESSKVKASNAELEKRVSERTEALEKQNRELKKANKELDRFIYSISHDIRAPLASLLGLISISKHETDIGQIKTYIELEEKSAKRLDNFIQDLISISKNWRLEMTPERVNLKQLIEDVVEQYSYLDNFCSIEKTIHVRQNRCFITDKYRLAIILSNLISNAIRYASPHRRTAFIRISAEVSDDKATVEVADNGRGIAPEHLDSIFTMFFRANHEIIGSGLGLYIAKETIEKLGGKVTVSSELGKGSAFTIEIPNKAK